MRIKYFAIVLVAFLMLFTATSFAYTYVGSAYVPGYYSYGYYSYGPGYYNYAPAYGYASSRFYFNTYSTGCYGCYPLYRAQPLVNVNYGAYYSPYRYQPIYTTAGFGRIDFNFNVGNPFCC